MKSLPFSGRSAFTFGISLLVMAALTFGVARVVVPASQKTPQTDQGPGGAKAGDVPAGFVTVPGSNAPGTPLGPPPDDQLIQLVSFNKDAPPPLFGERAPWWTPEGIPRVQHITQFDNGGDFTGVNCVMAAGAMLAQLGYGIKTSGSQMRRLLKPGHGGGTTLYELNQVVRSGWDVQFRIGAISPLMFRALLFAGAGAVIIVDYGLIPVDLRNQKNFEGDHAMYVDALRLRADGSGAEMYVMDPINRHHGDWWPADIVERAAMDFGGGVIATAWAFAGGIVPHGNYPPLPPPDLQPRDDQQPGHKPTDPPIAASPVPSASSEPTVDQPIGDPAPPEPPPDPGDLGSKGPITHGGYGIDFFLGLCVSANKPAFCPPGVPAVYPTAKAPPPTVPPLVNKGPLDLLYTDVPQPGVWRTIIGGASDVEPTFSYWPANGSGPALEADAVLATLGGKQVWMVTVPIPQAGNFAFLASTINGGVVTATDVGAISFGN